MRNLPKFVAAAAFSTVFASGAALADLTIAVPNGSEGDGLRAAATDYAAAQGINIEIVQAPYNNLFERAANAGATRSGVFDIILMDDPWIPFFAENGYLEELTSYFNAIGTSGPDSDFLAKSLAVCRNPYSSGPFVCLPYVGNAQMFFYDAEAFANAGVTGDPKTWDDVISAATAITEAGERRKTGYVFRGAEGNPVVADFMPLFWSYGGRMFDDDRNVTIDTPEAMAAMATFLTLKDISPRGVESYSADEVGRALAAGTSASSINWPNWVATFEDPSQSRVVGRIAHAPIPSGTHAGSSEIGHWTMGIMTDSENKQEAFDFMFWSTTAEQIKISATRGNPPVRFSVFTDPELTSQEQFRHFPILMEAINFSTPRPRHPQWPEIENAFGVELSKAVAGTISAEEALANAQAEVEAILAR